MIVLLVATATLIVLLTVTVFGLLRQIEDTVWKSRQSDAIRAATVAVETFNNQTISSLNVMSAFGTSELSQEKPELLAEWLTTDSNFLEVVLLDQQGDIVAGAFQQDALLTDAIRSGRIDGSAAIQNGETTIFSIDLGKDDVPFLTIAHPTGNMGVIVARVALEQLWTVLTDIQFGQTGIAYIVDRAGDVIIHPNQAIGETQSITANWPDFSVTPDMAQRSYANFAGEQVLGQIQPIPNTDWIIVTEVSQSEATFFRYYGTLSVAIGAIVIGVITQLSISRLLNRRIFQRLDALQAGADRMAHGNFNEPIPLDGTDEIGTLAASYNEMSATLRVRNSRIAAQNKALAEEVKDRKRAQENLQKVNNELIYASRYKDQFLATMSHELRTPLNAVLGMSEALLVPVYGELNERQQKAVQHVRESGQHLLSIIDDILDLSKIAAGRSPLEISPTSIKQVAESSIRMIRPIATDKEITVSVQIDPQVTNIMADERRLKQILVNLLNNAVKFTHVGGEVGLEVNGVADERTVEFVVFDTGIGIPENAIRQLFEPFMQVDGSLSRQYGGTGLGLTLVSRLVEMHEGVVEVDSTEGKGSRFTVSLPWREPQRGDTADDTYFGSFADQSAPSAARGAKILLAEDREANVLTLLDYLNIKGFEVLIARNGLEAVKMANDYQPDLILMDIQMPEMNGLDAIQHIRNNRRVKDIPIIALTALAMPGDRERCIAAGANDYVSKPVSLRQLVQTVEKHLGREEDADATDYIEPEERPFLVHGM
jgi:signal transduction histidine kinase/ActR/RegA family two-component response regulator